MILVALRAYGRTWPALLTWFLVGWTARLFLLRLAGYLAENVSPTAGQVVWALAVLVRLASYIAMFLVLRPALPAFERLDRVADREVPGKSPGFGATLLTTLTASILPFFVIYTSWGLVREDVQAYTTSALDQMNFGGGRSGAAIDVPLSPLTVGIVIVAFGLRLLIARLSNRLPRWTALVAAYLEAIWVFIALTLIGELLAGLPDWFASRRMFAWAVDGWAQLRDSVPAIDFVSDGWAWIAKQVGEVVGQPLAWLALAAIVLAGALPVARRRRTPRTKRATARAARLDAARTSAQQRWDRVGPRTRRVLMFPVNGVLERWRPIATALRLIWAAGPIVLGTYVLAYGVLTVGGAWLTWGSYRLLGPHDLGFWFAMNHPLELLTGVVLFPLQLCLIAAAFDRSLRALDERVTSPTEELAVVENPQ